MKDFLECTALVTGASAGIGREIARQLAPLAGTLILVARRADLLASLRDELLRINPTLRVETHTVDLSVPAQVDVLCTRWPKTPWNSISSSITPVSATRAASRPASGRRSSECSRSTSSP